MKCENCKKKLFESNSPKAVELADCWLCLSCYEDLRDDLETAE